MLAGRWKSGQAKKLTGSKLKRKSVDVWPVTVPLTLAARVKELRKLRRQVCELEISRSLKDASSRQDCRTPFRDNDCE